MVGEPARTDRDIYRLSPSMDAEVLETIATRLEARATDDGYVRVSQAYLARLHLADARRILTLGCGTGVEVRALRRLTSPDTVIVGVDHSGALLEVARRLTAEAGQSDNVAYELGDAQETRFDDDEFDLVVLHTVISHVDDPSQVLREARRVVRPGGTVAIFDGDYASLTFAFPDHEMATTIEERLIQLIVANPRVMRDMPRLLHEAGLELVAADGEVYANIGSSRFWVGAAESYGPLLARAELLPLHIVDDWRTFQVRSVAENTFFGASNYYTYVARRPDHQPTQ